MAAAACWTALHFEIEQLPDLLRFPELGVAAESDARHGDVELANKRLRVRYST
jgi:hypothetical protein